MTKTTEDLATEVMRMNGWLDANETPDSEDAAHITRAYEGFYADWIIRDLVYWPVDAIPDEAFQHITRIIADAVAPAFGDKAPVEIDIETGQQVSMGHKGWLGLKRLTAKERTGMPAEGSYF
jgi:hypothetical protein